MSQPIHYKCSSQRVKLKGEGYMLKCPPVNCTLTERTSGSPYPKEVAEVFDL